MLPRAATEILAVLLLLSYPNSQPIAKPKLNNQEILLGMSTALTGSLADLGKGMRAGVSAAIREANNHGGIQGHQLRLIALDDGYEPHRTIYNMHRLTAPGQRVFAIIGNVGTPTAVVAIPIAMRHRIPFIGALSGAERLRKQPPERYVVNYRASYREEVAQMVQHLIDKAKLKPREIAFFTQRDAFGDAGFNGGVDALKQHGLDDPRAVAHGRYEQQSLAVEKALADILLHQPLPKAVIMVSICQGAAKFIKLAKNHGLDVFFLNVSPVNATCLASKLGPAGNGVIITQVVPHYESSLPLVKAYRQALQNTDPTWEPNFISLEGYIVGRLLLKGLTQAPDISNSDRFITALENLGEFDMGLEVNLHLSPTDHQASHQVWATIIINGRIKNFDWDFSAIHD